MHKEAINSVIDSLTDTLLDVTKHYQTHNIVKKQLRRKYTDMYKKIIYDCIEIKELLETAKYKHMRIEATYCEFKTIRKLLNDSTSKHAIACALDQYEVTIKKNYYSKCNINAHLVSMKALTDNKKEALKYVNIKMNNIAVLQNNK